MRLKDHSGTPINPVTGQTGFDEMLYHIKESIEQLGRAIPFAETDEQYIFLVDQIKTLKKWGKENGNNIRAFSG